MKIFRNDPGFLESNRFKNYVIIFGMCLSLFTITSFDSVSYDRSAETKETKVEQHDAKCQQAKISQSNKQKTHHNFIASYLLEETSAKKEEKESGTELKFFSKLLQLHKTIFTNVFSQY